MPAREFVEEQLDDRNQRKVAVLFQKMADSGQIRNTEQFKHVKGRIYEFKRGQVRIGCFQGGRKWFLTHGFFKQASRWPPPELQRADNIRAEHTARMGL